MQHKAALIESALTATENANEILKRGIKARAELIMKQNTRIEKLREALEFYADEENTINRIIGSEALKADDKLAGGAE